MNPTFEFVFMQSIIVVMTGVAIWVIRRSARRIKEVSKNEWELAYKKSFLQLTAFTMVGCLLLMQLNAIYESPWAKAARLAAVPVTPPRRVPPSAPPPPSAGELVPMRSATPAGTPSGTPASRFPKHDELAGRYADQAIEWAKKGDANRALEMVVGAYNVSEEATRKKVVEYLWSLNPRLIIPPSGSIDDEEFAKEEELMRKSN